MVAGLRLAGDPYDLAIANEERLTAAYRHSQHTRDTEGLGDLAIRIGDQRKREFVFFLKSLLRLGRVSAHAENLQVLALQRRERVPQRTGLRRAAGGVGFRVKIDECNATPVNLRKINTLSILIDGRHNWRGIADFEGLEFGAKSEKREHGKRNYDCALEHGGTIVRDSSSAMAIRFVKSRLIPSLAISVLVGLAVALAASDTFRAVGLGVLGHAGLHQAGLLDTLSAGAFSVGGWVLAAAFRGLTAALLCFAFLLAAGLGLRWLGKKVPRLQTPTRALFWLLPTGLAVTALWQIFGLITSGGARIPQPISTALLDAARESGGMVFVNPSAVQDLAPLAPELLGSLPLDQRAMMLASPVAWREKTRENPVSAVLISGRPAEARPLVTHLLSSPDWHLQHVDETGLLFLRGAGPRYSPPAPDDAEVPAALQARALARMAVHLDEAGLKTPAREYAEAALELLPDDPNVLADAASVSASQGRWEQCRLLAEKALKANPRQPQALYLAALSKLETGFAERALESAEELIAVTPNDPSALWLHARTARSARDHTAEIRSLEKLERLADRSGIPPARLQIYLGQAWAQRGFPDQAERAYRRALEGDLTPGEARDIRDALKTIEENRLPTAR